MLQLSKKFIFGILAFLLILVFYALTQKEKQKTEMVFLDVGQGDAMLVSLPGDAQILIDAGPSDQILTKLSEYLPFYDKDIELAILTHPHIDHLQGFASVLKNYNVKNFIFSGVNYKSQVYAQLIEALKKEGSNIYLAKMGDAISYADQPILKILNPPQILLGQSFKNIHDSVIVSQLNLGRKKFLLLADADENLDRKLITSNLIEDIDVIKVGHHGSKTATAPELLKIAKPEEAVISVGRNSYGHPNPDVLERLQKIGAKIFRTDQVGDIIYQSR